MELKPSLKYTTFNSFWRWKNLQKSTPTHWCSSSSLYADENSPSSCP